MKKKTKKQMKKKNVWGRTLGNNKRGKQDYHILLPKTG